MAERPALALLLVAGLCAACGGSKTPPAKPPAAAPTPAPAPAPAGGGLDLSSLKGPEETKPGDGKPVDAKPADAKPADGNPADAKPADGKPADGKPADGKPADSTAGKNKPGDAKDPKDVPGNPEEILENEVMESWEKDERQAVMEMAPEEREKEIRKRRLEIFKQRGGKLDETSGKMGDKPADGADGTRGPARPDAVSEKDRPPAALREILDDLASRDPEVRARGVESARRFPDKTLAAHHLLPLLEDKDADLRVIVCSTLADLKQSDSVAALAKLIEKGDKDPVRAMALKALGDIGGPTARAALRQIAREGAEPSDRAVALGQLVKQREVGEVKDLLAKALDDINADVRLQAVTAIREFNLKSFEKEVFPRLEDASEQVVVEAIRTLGALNCREAVPALVKIVLKPDPDADDPEEFQIAANRALEAITGVNQGYQDTLPDAQKAAAIDGWRIWWNKNKATWK